MESGKMLEVPEVLLQDYKTFMQARRARQTEPAPTATQGEQTTPASGIPDVGEPVLLVSRLGAAHEPSLQAAISLVMKNRTAPNDLRPAPSRFLLSVEAAQKLCDALCDAVLDYRISSRKKK